ncbi:MAG: PQ-loop domain-containing transporter [Dehalococcoidia bacterium]|jgi:MtN3 and saliva related transmembrane protein
MNWQEILGIFGGLLGNVGIIPQIARLFRYKTAYEISLPFVYLWISSTVCWLVYGILFGLFAMIMWNSITLVLASFMLYAKLKWGIRRKADAAG